MESVHICRKWKYFFIQYSRTSSVFIDFCLFLFLYFILFSSPFRNFNWFVFVFFLPFLLKSFKDPFEWFWKDFYKVSRVYPGCLWINFACALSSNLKLFKIKFFALDFNLKASGERKTFLKVFFLCLLAWLYKKIIRFYWKL